MNKHLKILLLSLVLSTATLSLVVGPSVGCSTSAQRITYNTLYSVELGTTTAHDAFLDQVVAGKVKTNGVPAVAEAYNKFQAAMGVAIAAAQFNWTNPAPADLTALSFEVARAIKIAKGTP